MPEWTERGSAANERPFILAFVSSSVGELHCLLPILRLAKNRRPELRIGIIFGNAALQDQCAEDAAYARILTDLDAELVPARLSRRFCVVHRRQIRIIFKDYGPTSKRSLAAIVKRLCPRASLVLFPHAYAMYTSGRAPQATISPTTRKKFDQWAIDLVLLSSELDLAPWSTQIDGDKLRAVGATGYTEWWGSILRHAAHDALAELRAAAGDRKLVFLTTRGPHDVFLTGENHRFLVQNALEVILRRPDTYVALKPHPRENVDRLRELAATFPPDRFQIVATNTLAIASISAVTVSLWSSALLDSVAVGTPAIEFHRFHRPFPQSVIDGEGNVVSIYTSLGIAVRTTEPSALATALDAALDARDTLLEKQRAALAQCFPEERTQLDALGSLLDQLVTPSSAPLSLWRRAVSRWTLARLLLRDELDQRRSSQN